MLLPASSGILFFFFSFLLFICSAFAQEKVSKTISFGAFGGIDRGKLSYTTVTYYGTEIPVPESEWKTRAYFGIESDIWFSERWAIMMRPTYVQKGTYEQSEHTVTVDGKNIDINATDDITLTYFQLPLGVRGVFGKGPLKTSLFLGPTVDILLSAKDQITYEAVGDTTAIWTQEKDIKTNVEDIDLGIIAGTSIGYMFDSGLTIFLEAVYDYGVTNILSSDEALAPSAYTRDYRFGISLFYQIK